MAARAKELEDKATAEAEALAATQAERDAAAEAARARQAEARAARDALAAKAAARRVLVECPACGAIEELASLHEHQMKSCVNRLVPCKNWELGCKAMVRLSDRGEHESVEHLVRPRAALYLGGRQAFVAVEEDDLKPPWTAEYYFWRERLEPALRGRARLGLDAYDVWRKRAHQADLYAPRVKLVQDEVATISREVAQHNGELMRAKAGAPGYDLAAEQAKHDAMEDARLKATDQLVTANAAYEELCFTEASARARARSLLFPSLHVIGRSRAPSHLFPPRSLPLDPRCPRSASRARRSRRRSRRRCSCSTSSRRRAATRCASSSRCS